MIGEKNFGDANERPVLMNSASIGDVRTRGFSGLVRVGAIRAKISQFLGTWIQIVGPNSVGGALAAPRRSG